MTISTETIVLKVEAQTEGAERETRRLALAQRLLQREVQTTAKSMSGAAQAMADLPTTQTTSLLGKLGQGLKTAGVDAKTFSSGLKDIGKGLTFDLIRQGLKGLNTEIQGVAGSALSAGINGAAMGAAFAGPLGAAVGGVAGALVGLIRHTDHQSAASLRAAEAAKKHAESLQMVIDGETKARQARRGTREAEELAEEELNKARIKNTEIASEASAADLERARRALRDAKDERESLNRLDGSIWLEQRRREVERLDAMKDIEAARQSGIITASEAKRRLDDLNKSERDSNDIVGEMREKQKAAAEAVRQLNKALQEGRITAKEYTQLLRSADDDYRARDDERQKREEKAIARQKKLREELKANVKLYAPILEAGNAPKRDPWAGAKAEEARAQRLADHDIAVEEKMAALEKQRTEPNLEEDLRVFDAQEKAKKDGAKRKAVAGKSRLESAFGKLDEINAYKLAFDGLTGSVTSAMQAWIDGSMSAGQAAKKFAGEYLSTVAATLAIEALKEGAYAVASSIPGPFFNPAAAVGHAAAAGQYAVAAAAAAGVAKALGGGAAPTPSTSAGSGGADGFGDTARDHRTGESGPLSPDSGRTHTIVIYESAFADGSARFRRQRAQRVVAEVNGGIGWSND